MKRKISYIMIGVIFCVLSIGKVDAATYTPTANLFSGTQSNYLLQLGINQIDNFYAKDFVIFQVDNNYYLVAGSDVTIGSSSLVFSNATVISAVRAQSGNQYTYSYTVSTETSTTVYLSYIVISNIDCNNSVSSDTYLDYEFKKNLVNIGIFILGIVFAIFITKERRY